MDTQTMFLAIAVTCGVTGGLLVILEKWTQPDYRLAFMAFGFLMISAGVLLQYSRNTAPLWLAVGVGNFLAVVGVSYQAWSILAVTGRTVPRRVRVAGIVIVAFLSILAVQLVAPWPRVIGSVIYGALFLASAIALTIWPTGPRALRAIVATLLFVDALLYAVNAVDAFTENEPILVFSHGTDGLPITSLLYLMLLVTVVTLGFSVLLFVKRLSDEALGDAIADLDTSLETLATGVLIVDDGTILRANRAVADMLDSSAETLEGSSIGSLELVDPPAAFLEATRGRGDFQGELTLSAGTRGLTWALCEVRSVSSKTAPGRAVIALTDVTEMKRLQRELSHRLDYDDLTGLLSRGTFIERGQIEVKRAHRHHRPLAVFVFDLDRLKEVNDSAGHAFGDQALQHIAAACRDSFRDEDLVGRVGGDEFAGVLPDTTPAQAVAALERLLDATAATPLLVPDHWIDPSISVGVAELQPDESLDAALARADIAMYRAKTAGGRRVELAGATERLREV